MDSATDVVMSTCNMPLADGYELCEVHDNYNWETAGYKTFTQTGLTLIGMTPHGTGVPSSTHRIINNPDNITFSPLYLGGAQSYGSLVTNGGMNTWSLTTKPDGWSVVGGASAILAEDTAVKHSGTSSAKITRAGADAYTTFTIPDFANYKNQLLSMGVWVKASTAAQGFIYFYDGVNTLARVAHTGSGDWEYLVGHGRISNSATELTVYLKVETTDGAVNYDDAVVRVGNDVSWTI
jgi:hypothetical protein